jgi:transposase
MNSDNNSRKTARKTVEIGSKRIPMKKLLNGKEIREAAKALEDFRLHFTEHEILHGGRIMLKVGEYGEVTAVVKRLETDNEYNDRLEKARLAAEAKIERERKAALAKAEKERIAEENKRARTLEYIKKLAEEQGINLKEIG